MAAEEDVNWLDRDEMTAWLRLIAVAERLPGVLDTQLRRDSGLTHYEYQVLAMLSEGPNRTLRMTQLGRETNATLPRLSHVVRRLEERGFVRRTAASDDKRANDATLTDKGWKVLVAAAPGHVTTVRQHVFDLLNATQVASLSDALGAILTKVDPAGDAPQDRRDGI